MKNLKILISSFGEIPTKFFLLACWTGGSQGRCPWVKYNSGKF